MKHPPREAKEAILSFSFAIQLFSIAFIIAIGVLLVCHFGLQTSVLLGHTMAFSTLVVLELVCVQTIRAQYHIPLFSNPWLIVALITSLMLQLAVIYNPVLQRIFKTTALGLMEWSVILGIVCLVWLMTTIVNRLIFLRFREESS